MPAAAPSNVLIAGGGPAALEAALTLRDTAPELRVALLVPGDEYVYRPLSTIDPFRRGTLRRYPYADLAELGVDVHHDTLMRVDAERRVVVTDHGAEHGYDALLVAVGAHLRRAIPRVLNFGGPGEIERLRALVADVDAGDARRVTLAVPPGVSWTLPIYELALQLADWARGDVEFTLLSHEERPLEVFGAMAGDVAARLLETAGITFVSGDTFREADRVIALPVPVGHRVAGLPVDEHGFVPVDERGQAADGVWAAGDCAGHAIKQGGLAAQQAAVAADAIAAALTGREPAPLDDPVLRAMLITPRQTYFLRRRLDGMDTGVISPRALWWPPAKIAGPRLAPFLDGRDHARGAASLERKTSETASLDMLRTPA